MKLSEKISKISEHLFIEEPLLFIAFCSHSVVQNSFIQSIRSGNRKIEYNPKFIDKLSFEETKAYLKVELIRILLKHPYERKKANLRCCFLASQFVITDHFPFNGKLFGLEINLSNSQFERNESFEYYYNKLIESQFEVIYELTGINLRNEPIQNGLEGDLTPIINSSLFSEDSCEKINDQEFSINDLELNTNENPLRVDFTEDVLIENTELWDDDELFVEELNSKISDAIIARKYGTIPHNLIELIQKTIAHKLDYRSIIKTFRKNLIQSNSELTRRKPSRRYGFQNMGRRNVFTTKLLIAYDTSGSISNEELVLAFSIIKRFFKYGIKSLSYTAFDTEIKGVVKESRRNISELKIEGRGGTSFQCIFDYLKGNKEYDGVIIITDGCADIPDTLGIPRNKIMFLLNSKRNYESLNKSFKKIGKCCWVE